MLPYNKKPASLEEQGLEADLALKMGFTSMDDFRNSNAGGELRQISSNDLAEVAKFQTELFLPTELKEFVDDTSKSLSVPPEFIAIPLIVGLSSLIAGKATIKPKLKDDFCVFANLWGGVIGNPSSRKSDSLKQALFFFSPLEMKAQEDYDSKKSQYEKELSKYKNTKQALEEEFKRLIKKGGASTAQIEDRLNNLQEPEKICLERFIIKDCTTQKITEILRDNKTSSILLERDELSAFFSNLDKKEHEADRAYFLEMWNGNSTFRSDTIGRGSVLAKNASISIVGTTQHDKIKTYLERAANSLNDGLLQRFQLLVYPDPIDSFEYVDEKPNEEARSKISAIVRFLNDSDFFSCSSGSIEKDGKTYPYFSFDDEAQKIYQRWYVETIKKSLKLYKEGKNLLSQHLGKYHKLLPALCLIFYLVKNDKNQRAIDAATLVKAILFCAYLESHAGRIYGILSGEGRHKSKALELIEKIRKKFQSGEKQNIFFGEFTKRDLGRKFGSYKDDDLERIISVLVDHNHLVERHTEAAYQQKEKYSYKLHQDLIERWSNEK